MHAPCATPTLRSLPGLPVLPGLPGLMVLAALLVLAALCLTACIGATRGPEATPQAEMERLQTGKRAEVSLAHVQAGVMRFADRYATLLVQRYNELRQATDDPTLELDALNNSLSAEAGAVDIAIGPDPVANMLDMLVFVTLSRLAFENYWLPEVFGELGRDVLAAHVAMETEAWKLARPVLTPGQEQDLRQLIDAYWKEHPETRRAEAVRFSDFSIVAASSELAQLQASGGLLGDVSRATTAVEELKDLSERLLFYLPRLQYHARKHAQIAVMRLLNTPEMTRALDNFASLSQAAAELGVTAEELPALISAEREAAVDQALAGIAEMRPQAVAMAFELLAQEREAIFKELDQREGRLKELLATVDSTVARLDALVQHADATLATAEPLAQLLFKEDSQATTYLRMLEQAPGVLDRVDALLRASPATLDRVDLLLTRTEALLGTQALQENKPEILEVLHQAETGAKGLVGFTTRSLLLVCLAVIAAVVVARLVSTALHRKLFGSP